MSRIVVDDTVHEEALRTASPASVTDLISMKRTDSDTILTLSCHPLRGRTVTEVRSGAKHDVTTIYLNVRPCCRRTYKSPARASETQFYALSGDSASLLVERFGEYEGSNPQDMTDPRALAVSWLRLAWSDLVNDVRHPAVRCEENVFSLPFEGHSYSSIEPYIYALGKKSHTPFVKSQNAKGIWVSLRFVKRSASDFDVVFEQHRRDTEE